MKLSGHATRRGQQRGISLEHMEYLTCFGQRTRCRGGAYVVTLNRKGRTKLGRLVHDRQVIDKLRHQVLIVGSDGTVITAYHRN